MHSLIAADYAVLRTRELALAAGRAPRIDRHREHPLGILTALRTRLALRPTPARRPRVA